MGRGRGPNTADSYIGSLISLTSKSEIRYEGILYTVDTENSNIALQNVRSFGTEGRKKDGPQIPNSDKVYDYIIFRGSDIKDLQVKSSPPPPLQPPPPPQQPTDPAIISLQSQSQYPPPSSLGSYNGGLPTAGSSSEPNAPPPYSGIPPSQYRGGVPPLYPPAGLGSWGPPPPPPPGANGAGLQMPMYWQGYYRPPPAGHLQQQPLPPQPPPSLAPPPPTQQQPLQQAQQAPPLTQQLPPVSRPLGPIMGPSSSAPAGLGAQPQNTSSVAAATVPIPAAPVVPAAPVSSTPAATAPVVATPPVSAAATQAAPAASSSAPATSAPTSSVPVSAATSLPSSVQGVSAVITPAAKNPRRIVGHVYQAAQPSVPQSVGSSSQGLTHSSSTAPALSSGAAVRPQTATTQSSGVLAVPLKSSVSNMQNQAAPKLEQKASDPVKPAGQPIISSPSQPPQQQQQQQQQQVSQPLLPLPPAQQKHQPTMQRRGGHGVAVGQRNRWQGNGSIGNNNYNRRGRGRGSGRGIGLAHPTQHFTEDFDFTAMNEKFNKDEVWGELGGKGEKIEDEEDDYMDGNLEDEIPDVALINKANSDAAKKMMYVKDDFFDSLSCDALDREEGRAERTKFSEQRKIDTETFGNFPLRSRGGRGGRGGGRRGGYRGGYYGGGGFGGGRGGSYGRGRGTVRATTAIV